MNGMFDFAVRVVAALGGLTVVIGALVGLAYWLFKRFSEHWLQAKFAAKLEQTRHEQSQELEQLKFRINSLMDRATKLHEREYQILPDLWQSLASAWGEVSAYTSPFQSYPDVSRMTEDQLEEHLDRSELFESQKQAVRDSSDRTKTFQAEIYWHRKANVEKVMRTFSRTLRFNGIFVPVEIKTPMTELAELLWDALLEHQSNEEDKPRPRLRDARKRLDSRGKILLDDIEAKVRDRLWSATKLD